MSSEDVPKGIELLKGESGNSSPVGGRFNSPAAASGVAEKPRSIIDEFDRAQEQDGSEWQKMGMMSISRRASATMEQLSYKYRAVIDDPDFLKVIWLSSTLFFVVGGYWLLRSLKDPIISVIDGVEAIPMAKIYSLVAVFVLVMIYNKMLDVMPKHQLFYAMGIVYGVLFTIMGFMLMHPTIGLPNTKACPSRWLGWISYVTIESFGSMVVQCYWALVNASVDVNFAQKNFGYIIAGAQIGSILGPTIATQADTLGIPFLYLCGAATMFCMVIAMYYYVARFGGSEIEDGKNDGSEQANPVKARTKTEKTEGGTLEGFYLLYRHDFVKGIFFISSLFMVNVTVIDYMMKVLAQERYRQIYPDDPQAALRAFASFMGYFGQTTNSISFLFSLFGTGAVIKRFGLSATLLAFPTLLGVCSTLVWLSPTIWVVFSVMMVIKGMSYALNNPTKEILYQATSTSVKFKCKSWIDTFGQRSAKALGSVITNACASDIVDLNNYGYAVGTVMSAALLWISKEMGAAFERLQQEGRKVGEDDDSESAKPDATVEGYAPVAEETTTIKQGVV